MDPLSDTDKPRFMFEKVMPLTDAVEGYDLFDKMKVQKVLFEAPVVLSAKE
jgi:hypothetical protein